MAVAVQTLSGDMPGALPGALVGARSGARGSESSLAGPGSDNVREPGCLVK